MRIRGATRARRGSRAVYFGAKRVLLRRRLAGMLLRDARVHLGSGTNHLPGWINVDIERGLHPDVRADLRAGFPAPEGSVALIHSEHVFEHLELQDGIQLFADCRRILRPDGVIRVAMPDLDRLIDAYHGDWQAQPWLQDPYYASIDTPTHMLNYALRAWGHRYVYSYAELEYRLRKAGFRAIRRCEFGHSELAALRGLETRLDSVLIAEASPLSFPPSDPV